MATSATLGLGMAMKAVDVMSVCVTKVKQETWLSIATQRPFATFSIFMLQISLSNSSSSHALHDSSLCLHLSFLTFTYVTPSPPSLIRLYSSVLTHSCMISAPLLPSLTSVVNHMQVVQTGVYSRRFCSWHIDQKALQISTLKKAAVCKTLLTYLCF